MLPALLAQQRHQLGKPALALDRRDLVNVVDVKQRYPGVLSKGREGERRREDAAEECDVTSLDHDGRKAEISELGNPPADFDQAACFGTFSAMPSDFSRRTISAQMSLGLMPISAHRTTR